MLVGVSETVRPSLSNSGTRYITTRENGANASGSFEKQHGVATATTAPRTSHQSRVASHYARVGSLTTRLQRCGVKIVRELCLRILPQEVSSRETRLKPATIADRPRQFMVEEPSLQALIDISNHPTLSKRLTEVILSTAKYEEAEYVHSTTAQRLYMRGQTNNNILVSSGQARDMLLEAFNNVSLEIILGFHNNADKVVAAKSASCWSS